MIRIVLAWLVLPVVTAFFTPHSRCAFTLRASENSLDKPKWAGSNDLLSTVVNALINFKPLFGIMKTAARKTLIDTAENNGIPWRERAQELLGKQNVLERNLENLVDRSIEYPSYYTQEFHAYDEGNLNWQAAVECESATMSMALRVWPEDQLTSFEAQDRLRFSFLDAVRSFLKEKAKITTDPERILDVGSSVGVSTFYLARAFPHTISLVGLDLSPHFLAVALQRQKSQAEVQALWSLDKLERITWKHSNMEHSGLSDNEFGLTCSSFMFHELPQKQSTLIIREMYRVTKLGGVVAITDNNPKSPVIQNLPPVLFTLMKSTEPHSDEYYPFDIEQALEQAGFKYVTTFASDPRHRTILAVK